MAQKGNPISVRLDLNRSSDSSRFSDYYYGKSVYQDVNLRSYFGSIRPPTRLTFGFRLGRCIILHFPKGTFLNFFLPRRPRRLKRREKTKIKIFPKKKSRSNGPTSHLLKRILPAVRFSFHFLVMQYLLKKKNQIHFDPVGVINHFVARGVAEPSTMGGANAQGRSLDKRIRSRIAFFVESSTREKKCLAEAKKKKRLTYFIRQANDLRFAGTTKTTISLFPFFGATFFFPRDGVGVYNNLFFENAREQLLVQLRIQCWKLMGKDKVMELIEKFINLGLIGELIKGIEMMIEIILRNRRIPYGYNSYLNEMKKMRSLVSNRTKTNTLIESVKMKSVYQSASPIAQDISFQLRNKRRSFRSIFTKIVKDILFVMKKGLEGIRICCSGRSKGAKIARTECGNYGKTSRNVFNQKIDYAPAEVSTRYGISGVKVWISYSKKGGTCSIRNVRNIGNIVKADVVGVANRTVHNLVLEDMALKVVKLVVFHIEPLKQHVVL